jgi:hypothetical protein
MDIEMSFDYMFHIERKLDLRDNQKPFSINKQSK